ncbi:hypothetical protein NLU13_3350 [Sarocladium strictum]|uniref:BZIP transcription factor n=1 Tax=Sarocladium strictum TaxID=5046 RepID=A0AA39LA62_SARSR|nr:hypothetical protein NLU13_3350 [Sarocladium strictum]
MDDAFVRPATKDHQGSDSAQVAARRLKKRELDRKAQRLARERTKNRIHELESLVEQLRADSTNPEASNLTATLARVTQQRNELQNVLKSIDQTLQRYFCRQTPSVSLARNHDVSGDASDSVSDAQSKLECPKEESNVAISGDQLPSAEQSWQQLPGPPEVASQRAQDSLVTGALWNLPTRLSTEEHHHHSDYAASDDPIVPRPDWPCECVQPGLQNTWRYANKALERRTILSQGQLAIEDFTSEDTPIRAVLEGWDSVAKSGKMSVSWKKLREIDQACFSTCRDVERLAILRTMHLLMTYHGDPSQERCERVPRWLWTRPCQVLPHSYAIDFVVWPGVRERFIFSQHRYCTNTFWKLFRQSIRLNWPLDLQDCYEVDADTGRYTISSLFDSHLGDINAWRMTTDIFVQFPELTGDIPVYGSISPTVSWTRAERDYHTQMDAQRRASAAKAVQHRLQNNDMMGLIVHSPVAFLAGPDGREACHESSLEETGCSWPSV